MCDDALKSDNVSVESPRVSVVLTTYNRASILGETIGQILAQTYSDFELVIADDASTDNTAEVVERIMKADKRVYYQRNEKNLGMPGNLNAGIERCRGEYIANLHDGDTYVPQLLERWHDALLRCPKAAFVFNAYRALGPDGETLNIFREPLMTCNDGTRVLDIYFRSRNFGSPVWGTVMARRTAYESVGPFDARFGFFSDVDMWLRLAGQYDVAYVDEPLIGLAHRTALPRKQIISGREERNSVRQAFREARMRRYEGHMARLTVELGRHYVYGTWTDAYQLGLAVRRRVLQRFARSHGSDKHN